MKTLKSTLTLSLSLSLFAATTLLSGCAQTDHQNDKSVVDVTGVEKDSTVSMANYTLVGDSTMTATGAEGTDAVLTGLASNKEAKMKVKGTVKSVCQAKGCWMKVELPNGELMHVTFNDYSFFVPKDISGREVVIEGTAELDTMSVDDLRHYAEDANKTEAEIAAITEPKLTYKFDATGVLISKN